MRNTEKSLRIFLKSLRSKVILAIFTLSLFTTSALASEALKQKDGYVGSDKCKECHEKSYEGWSNTLHSKMVQDVVEEPTAMLGDFSEPGVKKYTDKHKISHTIGSHWNQRYMTEIKGEHYILPFSWSVVTRSWTFEQGSNAQYWDRRKYSQNCIGCHTTNFDPRDNSYTEHQIGCESCHGPGYDHITSDGDTDNIVNPAKLPDDLRDMVCAACHVKANDISMKYTFPIAFRPGENLADYLDITFLVLDEELTEEEEEEITAEEMILKAFNAWKERRKTPQTCDICSIAKKASSIVKHVAADSDDKSLDFCLGCHDFGERINQHTHHKADMVCNDCHKAASNDVSDGRNIHSYDYYMVHETGCYDPLIEKQCVKCHKDKTKNWATPYVIDWAVPTDFSVHKEKEKEDVTDKD
ncbi:multiheme c-type cytochrome [Thermodesulfobacteriota bacterium]